MSGPKTEDSPAGHGTDGTGQTGISPRRPPPMRTVTKGWWQLKEGEADMKEIERERDDEPR
jgi:hypothetical protein